jgi:hypothetical protein
VSVYAQDGAAVVVPLHGTTSLRLDGEGGATPHLTWPRPIVAELPLGEGAVAWSNGTARWPAVDDGYVLHRATPNGAVVHEVLPCRPTTGAWHAGRLYWTLFRSGLGIWTPGAGATSRHHEHSFAGIAVEDDGLWLAPLTRDADGRAVRQVHATGWRLDAADDLVPVALDSAGGCVARASGGGWTARAFPDTDAVQLAQGRRTADLICPVPVALAWTGPTLIVCTATGDVLRFPRLADILDRRI